jgi:hypothetical protein
MIGTPGLTIPYSLKVTGRVRLNNGDRLVFVQDARALRLHHHSTRPQSPGLDQRHNQSDSRMDRAPDNGGISLD